MNLFKLIISIKMLRLFTVFTLHTKRIHHFHYFTTNKFITVCIVATSNIIYTDQFHDNNDNKMGKLKLDVSILSFNCFRNKVYDN